jgi:hypothetical protein
MLATASLKLRPFPGYPTSTPAWNVIRTPLQKVGRKKKSDNFNKKKKKSLGSGYMNSLITSSFPIVVMRY